MVFPARHLFPIAAALALLAGPNHKSTAQPPPPTSGQRPGAAPGPNLGPPANPLLKKLTEQYGKAVQLQKDKKYPEAIAAYEEFIQVATAANANKQALLSAYSNMAMIYQAKNDVQNYSEILHRIIALDPKNPRPLAQLAIIEGEAQHLDSAESYANRALALKPPKDIASSAHFVKGNVAVKGKKFDAAAAEFRLSVQLLPTSAVSHFNYALALAELKHYDEAKRQLLAAQKLDPKNQRIQEYLDKLSTYLKSVASQPKNLQVTPPTQYDAILKKDPKNPQALLGRAEQLEKMGRPGDAISAYIDALKVTPSSYEAHFRLAQIYNIQRNFTAAKEHFQKAHQFAQLQRDNAKDARALGGLAGAEWSEGLSLADYRQRTQMFTLAEGHVKEALVFLPKDADLNGALGRVYESESRYKEAADVYRAMIALTPDSVPLYTRLSMTYKANHDIPGFVNVWKEFQAKHPDDPTSFEYISDIYYQAGRYQDSIDDLQDMLKHKLSNSVIATTKVVIGQDYVQLTKYDLARAEFKAVLELAPSKVGAQFAIQEKAALESEQRSALAALADIAGKENKFDDAIGYLKELKKREAEVARVNARKPTATVYKNIALLYERAKQPEMAIAEYQALAALLPSDPTPHEEIGRLLESENKIAAAAVEYDRASTLSTADPVPDRLKIAEMYQRHQLFDKALEVLVRLHSANLKNLPVLTKLAEVYRQLKQDQKALGVYDEIINVNPALGWVQDSRAALLVNLKRYPEAESIYMQEIERNPTAGRDTYASVKRVFQLENRPDRFMEIMRARFEKTPSNATLMAVVYDEYVGMNREGEGQAYILGIINKQPLQRRVCQEAYANLLQVHNHKPESLEIYRTIAKDNPKDISAWMNLAAQLDYNNLRDEANQVYVVQMARTDIQPTQKGRLERDLAMRYAAQDKNKESRALFQKIFDANKGDFDAGMRLGALIEKTATPAEALAFYTNLLEVKSYQSFVRVDIHNRMGGIYTGMGQTDGAVAQYKESLKLSPEDGTALRALKKLQGG